ncbi:MAG: imidazole glycerol phosphate synthase subunit HisH [Acidobacteria bacterium]|nr:imidazole glycerol phosphate synthase subunit HisH [Acidobacteriota bacterium]
MITVIDYGAGNLRSVENALRYLQAPFRVTSRADDVAQASAIVLPGVGHFGQMMRSLMLLNLLSPLRQSLNKGTPYLGICLGMHALYEKSEEAASWSGLAILRGTIRRFAPRLKVPHMGWNQLRIAPGARLFQTVPAEPFVYFAHSYYLPAEENPSAGEKSFRAVALSDYGVPFVAAVEKNNIYGVQFHPEKSGDLGLQMLRNFVEASLKLPIRSSTG